MKNISSYKLYTRDILESDSSENNSGMSYSVKSEIKKLCESLLSKEAKKYHNDPIKEHTYERYVNECAGYLKECMGHPGYSSINKPFAE